VDSKFSQLSLHYLKKRGKAWESVGYTHVNFKNKNKKKSCVSKTITTENIKNNKKLRIWRLNPRYLF